MRRLLHKERKRKERTAEVRFSLGYDPFEPDADDRQDDASRFVLRHCSKYAPLSHKKEKKLFLYLRKGTPRSKKKALRLLVKHNQRMVAQIAFRNTGKGLDLEDLMQAGNIGLMRAIHKFDPKRGYRLSTLATWWIREAIQRALRYSAEMIHTSVKVRRDRTKIQIERLKGWHEEGIHLSSEELAERTGLDEEYVRGHWVHIHAPSQLDHQMPHLHDIETPALQVEDNNLEPHLSAVERNADFEELHILLSWLSDSDREFISRKFGLTDNTPRTRTQMAELFGMSEGKVSQEEKRILKRLKELANRDYFNDFS